MLDYRHNSNNKRETEKYKGNLFWDKLVKVLFIFGVSIIVIMIALKWFGLIN